MFRIFMSLFVVMPTSVWASQATQPLDFPIRTFAFVQEYFDCMSQENQPTTLVVGTGHYASEDCLANLDAYHVNGRPAGENEAVLPIDLQTHDHRNYDALTLNDIGFRRQDNLGLVDVVADFTHEVPALWRDGVPYQFDLIHFEYIHGATFHPGSFLNVLMHLKTGGRILIDGLNTSYSQYLFEFANLLNNYEQQIFSTTDPKAKKDFSQTLFEKPKDYWSQSKHLKRSYAFIRYLHYWGFAKMRFIDGKHPRNGRTNCFVLESTLEVSYSSRAYVVLRQFIEDPQYYCCFRLSKEFLESWKKSQHCFPPQAVSFPMLYFKETEYTKWLRAMEDLGGDTAAIKRHVQSVRQACQAAGLL